MHKLGGGTRAHKVHKGFGRLVVRLVLESCGDAWFHFGECRGRRAAISVPWWTCRSRQSSLPGLKSEPSTKSDHLTKKAAHSGVY